MRRPVAKMVACAALVCACSARETAFVVDDHGEGETSGASARGPETPRGDGTTIRVGLLFALAGSKASLTEENTVNGIKLVVKQVNDQGGIGGQPVELVELYFDGTAQDAAAQARRAVDLGLTAVLGPSWSNPALAAAPILQEARLPELVTLATHPDITRGRPFLFRIVNDEAAQERALAGYVCRELGIRSYASFVDLGDKSSLSASDLFEAGMASCGARELRRVEYTSERTDEAVAADWARLLAGDAQVARAEVVFLPLKVRDVGRLMRAGRAAGFTGQFVGGDGWGNIELLIAGGGASRGALFVTHWNPDLDVPTSIEFLDEYYRLYRKEPTIGAAVGYDAARVLVHALRATPAGREGVIDRAALRDTLAALEDFPCTTGTMSFDGDRSAVRRVLLLRVGISRFEISKVLAPSSTLLGTEARKP